LCKKGFTDGEPEMEEGMDRSGSIVKERPDAFRKFADLDDEKPNRLFGEIDEEE